MTQKITKVKQPLIFKKNAFEAASWSNNRVVCGIDEVGRGCLAGPLVTAAVILPPHTSYRMLKDSKIMTEEERLKAYAWIIKNCWFGIGIVHNRIIDQHNIWQATLIAMKKAVVHVIATSPYKPNLILVDAMPLTLTDTSYHGIPVHHFTQGERRSSSIAAASIVAKVRRDAMMHRYDTLFPGYYLASHKGYSTKKHMDSLTIQRQSIIHRTSFLGNLDIFNEVADEQQQQTLC